MSPTHSGLVIADSVAISRRDVVMPVVPMFHANGWGVPHASAMVGAKQVLPGPLLDAASLIDLFTRERVTISAGVPTIWNGVLEELENNPALAEQLPEMRLGCGGAAPPEALIRRLDKFGLHIMHAWGMTETSPVGTVNCTKRGMAAGDDDRAYALSALQGVPLPFVDVRVRAEQGLAPWDGKTMGELEVRGPWVAASYYNNPAASDCWGEDGWFRTGDIATINEDGYLHITDRKKDLINSGGEWISSVDLESALMGHPAVRDVAVIAIAHPKWMERPLAIVVLKENTTMTLDELRVYLAGRFADFWLSYACVFVESLPRNPTGKILKTELRERYKNWSWKEPAASQTRDQK